MSVASNWGLLACVFFLVEGFFGETFLLCGVTISTRGSSSGGVVASPPPCSSPPSSPPPCPSTSSSLSEKNPLSSEALSFFLLFLLIHPTVLSKILNSGDYGDSYGVSVREFCISNRYKKFLQPLLCNVLHVFICQLVVRL
jgi:hypothetical protein